MTLQTSPPVCVEASHKEAYKALLYDRLELGNSIAWFLMDACWLLSYRRASVVWAAIAAIFALWAFYYVRRQAECVLVHVVMTLWLGMNAFWMCSDLYKSQTSLTIARGFLGVSGLVLLALWILSVRSPENRASLLRHFRRFRFEQEKH